MNHEAVANLGADDGAREEMFRRVCKMTRPVDDGFISRIDSPNRARDAVEVGQRIGLTERGRSDVRLGSSCPNWIPIATGYERIVYGDHGPYVELKQSHINFESFSEVHM